MFQSAPSKCMVTGRQRVGLKSGTTRYCVLLPHSEGTASGSLSGLVHRVRHHLILQDMDHCHGRRPHLLRGSHAARGLALKRRQPASQPASQPAPDVL
jgi:hypothetical protein